MIAVAVAGGVVFMVGVVAAILVERQMSASLAELPEGDPTVNAYSRAASHALVGVAIGVAAWLLLAPGPSGLLGCTSWFIANAVVLYLRRRRCSSARLQRAAAAALVASICLFVGVAAFLLGGGKSSLGL